MRTPQTTPNLSNRAAKRRIEQLRQAVEEARASEIGVNVEALRAKMAKITRTSPDEWIHPSPRRPEEEWMPEVIETPEGFDVEPDDPVPL